MSIFIPNPQKFVIRYQKSDGTIKYYTIVPIEVNNDLIIAYAMTRGVRSFSRNRILGISQV